MSVELKNSARAALPYCLMVESKTFVISLALDNSQGMLGYRGRREEVELIRSQLLKYLPACSSLLSPTVVGGREPPSQAPIHLFSEAEPQPIRAACRQLYLAPFFMF